MNQIRAKHSVTVIADRLKKAGKSSVPQGIRDQMDFQGRSNQQHISLVKGGRRYAQAIKTHVADLPLKVQNLLAEEFEREVIAFREKLESEYAEIKRDKNQLAVLNEQQSVRIDNLTEALKNASATMNEQARRISQLKNEIVAERDAHARTEQRIRNAMQELTRVEHTLDDSFPESSGGA
jgi:methyl-accepting chemotaxis protein